LGIRQIARPELLSGLLTGLALSSVFFPIALLH
jgi:magnesium transporter